MSGGPDRDEEHEEFEALAVGWALHALEPEDAASFAAHQATCSRCTAIVEEIRLVMAGMAGAAPPAEPSDDLRSRLRAAVAEAEQEPVPAVPGGSPAGATADRVGGAAPIATRRGSRPRPVRRRLLAATLAAAAAAVVGLGVALVVVIDSRDEARASAQAQAQIIQALLDPGSATITAVADAEGRAVATVLAREDEVQVVTHGMAANDSSDTTYVLWGIRNGSPRALGTFDVVDAQGDLQTFAGAGTPPAAYSAYGISLEPGRVAPSAPTDVVAVGEVPA
jgi:anti-sigma-K factor RskA